MTRRRSQFLKQLLDGGEPLGTNRAREQAQQAWMPSASRRLLSTCKPNGNVISGNAAACVASGAPRHGRRVSSGGAALLSSLGGTH